MSGLIWVGSLVAYATGFVLIAALTMRFLNSSRPARCHMESRTGSIHQWSQKSHCDQFCKPGCWRTDDGQPINSSEAIRGSAAGMVWPLLLLPLLAFSLARHSPVAVVRPDRIAALERELGL